MAANGASVTRRIYDLSPAPGICPYVQRAKIVLKEKKLEFDTVYVDGKNKDQDFLDLFRSITSNPGHRGTVPVLVDGDVKLAESEVVSEFLDREYPDSGTKLYPNDPYKLALVRLFVDNYVTQVQPSGAKVLSSTTLQEFKDALAAFTAGLKILDTFLKTYGGSGPFLLDDFSYAEAGTLPFIYRANLTFKQYRNLEIDGIIKENGLNHLQKWKEAGFARESVKSTLPPDQVIVARGKDRIKVAREDLK